MPLIYVCQYLYRIQGSGTFNQFAILLNGGDLIGSSQSESCTQNAEKSLIWGCYLKRVGKAERNDMSAVMSNEATKKKSDDYLEWQFVLDYAEFGARINLLAVIPLLEKARSLDACPERKSLCLSGQQLMFSSWEDFALLLKAFQKRKVSSLHIHRFMAREEQKQGSTDIPNIFKNYQSARQTLDDLGFTSINHRYLTRYHIDISKAKFEADFREFADAVKKLGKFQSDHNEIKNRLKHGKGLFESDTARADMQDNIFYLRWVKSGNVWELERRWHLASLKQLEIAVIHIAKLYQHTLKLLWFFMLHYHRVEAAKLEKIMKRQWRSCVQQLRLLGIVSTGLTQ